MTIVAGFDVHRAQITFDALDADTGELRRGRIAPTPAAVERLGGRSFRPGAGGAVAGCGRGPTGRPPGGGAMCWAKDPCRSRGYRPNTWVNGARAHACARR